MIIENLLDDKLRGNKLLSSFRVNKKKLLKSGKFNMVLIRLDENQEIPPHPEPYAVAFIILDGEGIFTSKAGEYKLKKDSMISMQANEIRGIKALEKMIIVGIQDGH